MRLSGILLASVIFAAPTLGQTTGSEGPTDEKAKKTYEHALEEAKSTRGIIFALDDFKKADKQDGGRCRACQRQMVKYGIKLQEWKTAEFAAAEMIEGARDQKEIALAHYQYAVC